MPPGRLTIRAALAAAGAVLLVGLRIRDAAPSRPTRQPSHPVPTRSRCRPARYAQFDRAAAQLVHTV